MDQFVLCDNGMPKFEYILSRDFNTVELKIFAAGNQVNISCTTKVCFESGIGPKRSMLTSFHGWVEV